MKKEICEFCLDFVVYTVKKKQEIMNIRGKDYKYIEKHCYCNICGSEIIINKIISKNIKNINRVIEDENNRIGKGKYNDKKK